MINFIPRKRLIIIGILVTIFFLSEYFIKIFDDGKYNIESIEDYIDKEATLDNFKSIYLKQNLATIKGTEYINSKIIGLVKEKIEFKILKAKELPTKMPELWLYIQTKEKKSRKRWIIGRLRGIFTIKLLENKNIIPLKLRFIIVSFLTLFLFLLISYLNHHEDDKATKYFSVNRIIKYSLKKEIVISNIEIKGLFVFISYFLILLFANNIYSINPEAFNNQNIILLIFDWTIRTNNFLILSVISGLLYFKLLK